MVGRASSASPPVAMGVQPSHRVDQAQAEPDDCVRPAEALHAGPGEGMVPALRAARLVAEVFEAARVILEARIASWISNPQDTAGTLTDSGCAPVRQGSLAAGTHLRVVDCPYQDEKLWRVSASIAFAWF